MTGALDNSRSDRDSSPLIGGPEKVPIVIAAYNLDWPLRFDAERVKIEVALGVKALAIEHIGSTAVVGLPAKPIIDICLVVADSAEEASYVRDLESAGYELRVREPEWHEHRMLRTLARDVHVHVFTIGSSEVARHLAFRDWLRTNPEDRDLYAETKQRLAEKEWPTMQDYADAKSGVIAEITARSSAP